MVDAGIAQGVYNSAYSPINAMTALAKAMDLRYRTYFGIQSPSKKMAELSKYLPEGAAQGVEAGSDTAVNSMEYMGDSMIAAIMPAFTALAAIFDAEYDFDPTIRPTVDLTDVTSSAEFISSLMSKNYSIGANGDIITG